MMNQSQTDWQQNFIATNLIALGYNAWMGYLKSERGVVVCSTNTATLNVVGETFPAHFVCRRRLAPFLNAWLATPDTVILQQHFMKGHILQAADNYNPKKDLILLLESGQAVNFFYLTDLPISPPECYDQVLTRYSDFRSNQFSKYSPKN
ncbi:hypothetical protein ACL6C3_19145 [Capilliphycus salinus ALCB114379]|uniref:hypothetical protein n=1 Tax=Capilliphycus salinus TaxID=2768948 RepID=UPI0039A60A14